MTSKSPRQSLYAFRASRPLEAVEWVIFSLRMVAIRSLRFISLSSTRRTRRSFGLVGEEERAVGGMFSFGWLAGLVSGMGIGCVSGCFGIPVTSLGISAGGSIGIGV